VKERPILFSGEMVKAILAGRKTQTRRVLQQPRRKDGIKLLPELLADMGAGHACPYGAVGDRLYVREAFGITDATPWVEGHLRPCAEHPYSNILDGEGFAIYAADGEWTRKNGRGSGAFRWMPSIHMPRWASRIMLEIVDVRVERVQDISENDAISEGMMALDRDKVFGMFPAYAKEHEASQRESQFRPPLGPSPRQRFAALWDSLNAVRGYGWDANPWVWAIEFKRIEAVTR